MHALCKWATGTRQTFLSKPFANSFKIQKQYEKCLGKEKWRVVAVDKYGVPSPPKFNVAFYVLLLAFYPTFVVWHRSLHFRHSTFLVQHSSFCFVHSPFPTQYSSSRSTSAGCTFKFLHSMLSICQSSFCFQHLALRISLASLHSTFNFSNCTFHPLIIHQG